ncbi:hypothetical protein [Sphingopyxis sp. H115]|uniref:hypothetical protein n=1 Tax=Sphingopyxis sp. H115 TaxID=1759073 RepID=UPI000736B96E|nr:hypothetical protein [Sphingopyxis sp. H115]KTE08961.1 hypothetical protein ATE71_13675 [Sphingopyxis sp. H115]
MKFRAMTLLLLAASPAFASAPQANVDASCSGKPVLPPELSGWSRDAAGRTIYAYGDDLGADWSPLGAARTMLPLHRFESLRYGTTPERKPDVHKFGGMIPIEVKRAGRLMIALDQGAWIDLVQDGVARKSVAHGHGPGCSGIRKLVEYDVTPGRYQLQIVNAPAASIRAMAVLRD